jgi:hypothetical protein
VTAPAAYVDALQAAAGYTGPAEYPSRVARLDASFLDFLNTRARLHPGPIRRVDTPAAVFPDRLVGVPDATDPAALRARLASGTDFLRQAFIIGADEAFSGKSDVLAIQRPSPEEIRVRVRCDGPRVLVLPETDDGGWTARAKEGPLATLRLNGAFLGIRVPAGETAIVCRYAPPGIRAGAWISLASAALLAATAVAIRRRR